MVRSRVMIRVHSCSFIGNLGHIPSMMVCMVVHYLGATIRQGHGVGTWQQQNIVNKTSIRSVQLRKTLDFKPSVQFGVGGQFLSFR